MANINFGGLASGLDTSSIITALVNVARAPIDKLETKKANYNSQLDILSDVSTKLSSLRTAAQELDSLGEFKSYTAQSSDTDKITATASNTAVAGTFSLNIKSLAWAERTYGNELTSEDQLNQVGTGTLRIRVGSTGDFSEINIDQSIATLEDVSNAINDKNCGVTASVVKYSDNSYRLMVIGNKTGEDNDIQFEETGDLSTTLGLSVNTAAQAASDAHIVMDGKDIYRDSNQITDGIPGVTLNLIDKTDPDTVNVTVSMDPDAITDKVSSFVSAYNSVATLIKNQSTYTGEARTDTLIGDSTIRQIKLVLQTIVTGQVDGATGDFKALSRVGISTNRDGTLTLDKADFKEALADDLGSVTSLFTYSDNNSSTENDGVGIRMVRNLDNILRSPDGILMARKTGINNSIATIDDRIESMERNLTSYEDSLRKQYTNLETTMANIQNQGKYLNI